MTTRPREASYSSLKKFFCMGLSAAGLLGAYACRQNGLCCRAVRKYAGEAFSYGPAWRCAACGSRGRGGIFWGCRIGMFFIVKINDMMYRHFLFTLSHPEKYVKMASYRVSTRSMFLGNTMIFLRKHIVYPYSPAAFRKVGAKRHVRACRFI